MIGLAAPAIFALNRLLGPRAVAAMLERFSPVTLLCGGVLLMCWLWEWRQSSTRNGAVDSVTENATGARRNLRARGACLTAMFLLGAYLALVAEPRIRRLQPPLQQTVLRTETVRAANGTSSINPTKVVVESGRFASPRARQEFRKLHGLYGGLTSLVVLLGLVVLALHAAPSSRD